MRVECHTMKRSPTTMWALILPLAFLAGCAGGKSAPLAIAAPATITAQLAITTTSLPAGTYGQFYDATLQASGGVPPYQWLAVQGDPLSAGLTLNQSTGEINGVLSAGLSGSAELTIGVMDSR